MRWLSRGVAIRLFIYVPLIGFLGWRAMQGRCGEPPATMESEPKDLQKDLEPYRKVITLPDGTQQEIVELTPEQAEAVLGHPLPEHMRDDSPKAEPPKAPDAEVAAPVAEVAAPDAEVAAPDAEVAAPDAEAAAPDAEVDSSAEADDGAP